MRNNNNPCFITTFAVDGVDNSGRAADGGGYYARDASRPVVFTVEEALQIVLEIKNLRCNRNKDGAYLIKP